MNTDLVKRFINDCKYPIQLIQDDTYFDYMLDLTGAREDWDKLMDTINTQFSGSADEWLKYFYEVREKVVQNLNGNEKYKEFIKSDMNNWKIDEQYPVKDLYKQDRAGQIYLSIDLKKANFQAFRKLGIHTEKTWDEYISFYTDSDYIKNSKYFRSVVYGNVNPKRTIVVEKWLIWKIHKLLNLNLELFSVANDEIIYSVPEDKISEVSTTAIPGLVKENLDLEVSVNLFRLNAFALRAQESNRMIKFYEKESIIGGEKTLHCIPVQYYPIVMKLYSGNNICDFDTWFESDGIKCKMTETFVLEKVK